jgi:soluble P-type ATPase
MNRVVVGNTIQFNFNNNQSLWDYEGSAYSRIKLFSITFEDHVLFHSSISNTNYYVLTITIPSTLIFIGNYSNDVTKIPSNEIAICVLGDSTGTKVKLISNPIVFLKK